VTRLRPRDNQILRALTLKVRLFSLEQLASAWWTATRSGRDNARKRMAALSELGLVARLRPLARPLPQPIGPLAVWKPGDPKPGLGELAWTLQSRWETPPRTTTCLVATRRAPSLFGGKGQGEIKQEHQVTHDLGVAAVYLFYRTERPEDEKNWIGEDILRPYYRKRKLPDAVLAASPTATPEVVVEYGGAYDVRRLTAFHRDCAAKNQPYELW
jgi:hypothetical protein